MGQRVKGSARNPLAAMVREARRACQHASGSAPCE
jgi:hypothetical protein